MNESKSSFERKKTIKAGSEIIAIDHKNIDEIMREIGKHLSSDENSINFKYFQAGQMFEFFRHLNSPFTKDSIQVRFVSEGDTNEIYFQTGTAPVYTMNARLRESAQIFDENEANMGEFSIVRDCGYFRFRSFKSSAGKNYEIFLANSFKTLNQKKVKKLVVDLRGNTGGAMQYSFMRYIVGEGIFLGKYVIEKPKNGFENGHLKKLSSDYLKHKRGSKAQKRLQRRDLFNNGEIFTKKIDAKQIFEGEIIVITDEGTFSSAAILACHLKTLKNAKIIGRKAGGSFYSGNAGSLVLNLPESNLNLFVNPNTFGSQLPPSNNPIEIKEPDVYLQTMLIDKRKIDAYYLNQAVRMFK